ncbi:MAG: repressor LexA [Planctomycetaceae bacterium]|nr:repressor LexA [Planctomycetaceae bacterium]
MAKGTTGGDGRAKKGTGVGATASRPALGGASPEGSTRERIYQAVRAGLDAGRAPSLRELREAVGLKALESVRAQLEKLVQEGRLVKQAGARGWALAASGANSVQRVRRVPLLGRVPAGNWSEALEHQEGELHVECKRGSGEGWFALRVVGDSMVGAAILDGDVVVVDSKARAKSGDIVVARLDGEATVKRLFVRGRRVELRPENPAYNPIVPGAGAELEILGPVVEVRRSLLP